MASVETPSFQHFWRYQREVFGRAGRRWWANKGRQWWPVAAGTAISALVEWQLGADPAWWHAAASGIGGGAGVGLLLYLIELARTRALIDQEKTERISRLSGKFTEEEVKRSHLDRIRIYKGALRVASQWEDLAALIERDPQSRSARRRVEDLRVLVDDVSDLVMNSFASLTDRYTREVKAIRQGLLPEAEPSAVVEELREPIRRIVTLADEDKQWDLKRKPEEDEAVAEGRLSG